ncbi:MAG: aldo/keto reductase [Sedimentisphaerales bacterium]|nr:aldo/keto reductase [Sedimentisphaerales bacterium]
MEKIDRRNMLLATGAAGLGAAAKVFAADEPNAPVQPSSTPESPEEKLPQVPLRVLGKTKLKVPMLCLGAGNYLKAQVLLAQSVKWGINFWDTAPVYYDGNCDRGIGKYLQANPEYRKKLLLITKASFAKDIEMVEKLLQESLQRLNTDYIDFFYGVHGMDKPEQLNDELKAWAEKAKKRGKIRFFGCSMHSNMAACLQAVAKCGWVDVVTTTYNFRLVNDKPMQDAIEACHKAGVGLVAMKTQGARQKSDSEEEEKIARHFLDQGYTLHQAKLKIVWRDERFASICSQMENIPQILANVAASLDKTKLSAADRSALERYAQATCGGYCAGCTDICSAFLPDDVDISRIMRSLMYHYHYGDPAKARDAFARVPAAVRSRLLNVDYRRAEARCPNRLPIGEFIADAVNQLA